MSAAPRRGRDASYPTPPAQIPACGFSAPGSSVRRASALPVVWEKAIPLREVGLWTPALHVRHTFPLRAASHRHPLPHVDGSPALRVLRGDPTPHASSALLRVVGNAYLSPGMHGVSQVLNASLSACQALRTPTDPPASRPADAFVWASGAFKPSPSAFLPLRGCTRLQDVRSPFRPTEFPVYASSDSCGVFHLLHRCNTRYGWLARPYPVGDFHPTRSAKLRLHAIYR